MIGDQAIISIDKNYKILYTCTLAARAHVWLVSVYDKSAKYTWIKKQVMLDPITGEMRARNGRPACRPFGIWHRGDVHYEQTEPSGQLRACSHGLRVRCESSLQTD